MKYNVLADKNITDRALLIENLYARCLHIQTDQQKDQLAFFNYLYNMHQDCFDIFATGFWASANTSTITEEHMKKCAAQ